MGLFWNYFKDGLRWPLIQRAGALAALAEGAARTLDQAREDILWLRRQFHPATCEEAFLDRFGQARGLVRRPGESAERWRTRVVLAYAFQRLGGSQSGMPVILDRYGFQGAQFTNLRAENPARWAEFSVEATATRQITREELDAAVWLINEYKPARSRLAEVVLAYLAEAVAALSAGAVGAAEAAAPFNDLIEIQGRTDLAARPGAVGGVESAVPFNDLIQIQAVQPLTIKHGAVGAVECSAALVQLLEQSAEATCPLAAGCVGSVTASAGQRQ